MSAWSVRYLLAAVRSELKERKCFSGSAFGLSQFPNRLVSLKLFSCLAVGLISYAHCISGPPLSSLANKSRNNLWIQDL